MKTIFSKEDFTKELFELIKIQSISAWTQNKEETFRVLEKVQSIVQPMQFETLVIPTKGNPVLVGTLRNSTSKEWLTIYNHLDVQPAEEPQWKTKPFEPMVLNGAVYGRGATDDKGPALTILHAIRSMQQQNIPLPNIQLVYETEEEIGSTNFGSFLEESIRKKIIREPNSILVSDSEFEGEFPSINYKLRGMARVFMELETATQEAHSGVTGGVAKNPLEILSRIIVSMKNDNGQITIPHYLDDVSPISLKEKEFTQKVAQHMDVQKFKRETGLNELFTENPEEMLNRIWHSPTIEMHGFEGAQFVPNVIKTAIPNKVIAKLTLRLVPNQTPEKSIQRIREYAQKLNPRVIVRGDGGSPSVIPLDNPYMKIAVESSKIGFGKEPLFVGSGGSIGAVAEFQHVWKNTPIVLLSQSLLSDGYHAPNEHFRLDQAEKGMKTMANYLFLVETREK